MSRKGAISLDEVLHRGNRRILCIYRRRICILQHALCIVYVCKPVLCTFFLSFIFYNVSLNRTLTGASIDDTSLQVWFAFEHYEALPRSSRESFIYFVLYRLV